MFLIALVYPRMSNLQTAELCWLCTEIHSINIVGFASCSLPWEEGYSYMQPSLDTISGNAGGTVNG